MHSAIKKSLCLNRTLICCVAALCLTSAKALAAIPSVQTDQFHPAPQCMGTEGQEMCAWIEAGRLADLHWPNFFDYRTQVKNFYQSLNYELAWSSQGRPTAQARDVIRALQNAEKVGLSPIDYDGPSWNGRLQALGPSSTSEDLARFDLALTVSVMRYLIDVSSGRIDPENFKFDLNISHQDLDLAYFIRARLMRTTEVASALSEVEPPYLGYQRAKAALALYLVLQKRGDPQPLTPIKKQIKPGEIYGDLPLLDQRLRQLGDLTQDTTGEQQQGLYTGALVEAVKHFQQRSGLSPDGVLGPATVYELNVPLSQRVTQLRLTLERWRWLPHDLPSQLLAVNIPAFELYGYDNHHVSLSMRVVVGRAFRGNRQKAHAEDIHQTPVFIDEMEYVIFRPYWNVPRSIARKEILPALEKDAQYLAKHRYEIYDNRQNVVLTEDTLDPNVIAELGSGRLAFRQKPGPSNALGLVKFVFPNRYDVYLHGTPERHLFERTRRDFSHGCIRVQDPVALAKWTLRDDPQWTEEQILKAMNGQYPKRANDSNSRAGEEPFQVKLPQPIPVLILYGTALIEENGDVRFFDDIYGYDKDLERALESLPPRFH